MDFYQDIIQKVKEEYESKDDIYAMFVTGSVARDEHHKGNDLDILFVSKEKIPFKEYRVEDVLVELSGNSIENRINALEKNPSFVYMYLESKAIFDKGNYFQQLQDKAKQVLANYQPTENDKKGMKKWLISTLDKVEVAKENDDLEKVGFAMSTNLWKTVEGLYAINSMPTPAFTTALRKIKTLKILPDNFETMWSNILLGDLEKRTEFTMKLIEFIVLKLD